MLNHTCRMRLFFSISVLIAVSATGLSGERSLAQNSEPEHGSATAPSMFSNPSLDSYKMDLLVSPNESSIKGTVLLRYRNNSPQALSAIRLDAGHDAVESGAWILMVQALLSQMDRRGQFPLGSREVTQGPWQNRLLFSTFKIGMRFDADVA